MLALRSTLVALGRNLAAGARLAYFLPVDRRAFRADVPLWLLVVIASALLDVALDGLRAAPGATFALSGLDGELYAVGLLMLTSALIAVVSRDPGVFVALPVVVLSAFPMLQIIHAAPAIGGADLGQGAAFAFEVIMFGWMVAVCIRSVYVVGDVPQRRPLVRAVAGGLLVSLPLWFAPFAGPSAGWWIGDDGVSAESPSPASEPVLAAQAFLLDHALDELDDPREGAPDLYFVGFAPDSRQDGFRQEVDEARNVLDERFGTNGHSINLVNHADTVAELPFATLTNLRQVLQEIGEGMKPDEDVVMLYLTAGGAEGHGLAAVLPPLELVPLTPGGLKQLLDNAGIRYRVIVVGTCAAGAWLDTLRDDDTAVLVSTPDGDPQGGCEGSAHPSAFSQAVFGRALRKSGSITDALAQAARDTGSDGANRVAIGSRIAAQLARVARGPALRNARLAPRPRLDAHLTHAVRASTIPGFP